MLLLLLLGLVALAHGWYSVKYYIGGVEEAQKALPQIANSNLIFAKPPSAAEVADLVVRLSGLESQSKVAVDADTLPRLEAKDRLQPLIYEVKGGLLPASLVTEVVSGSAFEQKARGPNSLDVVDELQSLGRAFEVRKFNGEGENIKDFVEALKATPAGQPVIILHQETPADYHYRTSRRLSSSSSNSTGPNPAIEAAIGDYNIVLWTSVILIFSAYFSVMAITNMEVIPDSLLFAKFTSGRGKKSD
jgi:hypothetical protein